ncbi:MAG TPA: cytochrome c nitrite reductase small subunit [Verrucomicrobiae bacterium]|jgi:cytochrome c nitrite reductase small subunit
MKASAVKGIIIGAAVGIATGIGAFTFIYAKGASYLTNDPKACANCHIMQDHYDAWLKSSHRSVAVCNDCHAPHNFLGKYWVKADNGFWHSFAFTTGKFQDPIRIKKRNLKVTEKACLDCHKQIVEDISAHAGIKGQELSCVRCHDDVGHAPNR